GGIGLEQNLALCDRLALLDRHGRNPPGGGWLQRHFVAADDLSEQVEHIVDGTTLDGDAPGSAGRRAARRRRLGCCCVVRGTHNQRIGGTRAVSCSASLGEQLVV